MFSIRKKSDRDAAARLCNSCPIGTRIEFKAQRRSLPQNSTLWLRLSDISRQLIWHGERLSPRDWKTVLMGAFRKQRLIQTPDGSFVRLGLSTSDLTKEEMSEFLDLVSHFAHQYNVELSDEVEHGQ